jgi:peptide/nickel transport system substrate-binding protein
VNRMLLAATVLVCAFACSKDRAVNRRDARVLVAAVTADPGHLNPAITTNGGVSTASALLFDGLVALDDAGEPLPALAARWEVLESGKVYRFHLRPDVRWHDGQPLRAHDVEFTFDSLLLRFHARTRASLSPALDSVRAEDSLTVGFYFRRPYAPLLKQLDVVEAPILPRHVYSGGDPLRNPANTSPVGTGPFRFVRYVPQQEITYEANASYFRGKPWLNQVTIRVIPDEGTQVMAMEAGEVDWLFAVAGPQRPRVRKDPRISMVTGVNTPGGSNCVITVGFNLEKSWLRDIRFRSAVAHAIDRPQFVERVLYGDGRPAAAPISSRIAFAHPAPLSLPAFDTLRAERLLDSAGWRTGTNGMRVASGVQGKRDGEALTLTLTVLPSQQPYGELLQGQLRRVGIDMRVRVLESAVFAQTVFTARDFDTAIASYCNGQDPEIGVRRQYVTSSIGPIPFSNMAAYRNPAMDSLFDLASASLDVAARGQYYQRIQEIAVRDLPYVWLVETENSRAHARRCSGFGRSAHFAATARCES